MYVIDFCIISLVYLIITTYFYFYQKRVPSLRSKFFSYLLIIGLTSLLLDILAAITSSNENIPQWFLYIINILFLTCVQINGPVFLIYTCVLTGIYKRLSKIIKVILSIPFVLIFSLLLLTPLIKEVGIFFFTKENIYTAGTTHILLYVIIGLYLLSSLVLSIVYYKKISIKKITAIVLFLLVNVVTMLYQMNNSYILVNSMGNALALTIMYHVLQLPDDHIDSLTGLLNRTSFQIIINECFEQNINFNLIIFPLKAFHLINKNYGIKSGDNLMIKFSEFLRKKYFGNYIFRITGDVYAVLIQNSIDLSKEYLSKIKYIIPNKWEVYQDKIDLDISVVGLSSKNITSSTEIIMCIDYIITNHENNKDVTITLINEKYMEEIQYYHKTEIALLEALDNDELQVYYQPIHDVSGNLIAMEALSRIYNKDIGWLRPDIFINIAEKNGTIYRLGELVLDKVCKFIEKNNVGEWGLHHVGVNLSFLQCTRNNLFNNFMTIMNKYNIKNNLISFEITETESSSLIPIVRDNMNKFIEKGFSFLLDDFGSGYANFSYIFELPFSSIKLDKMLLWRADTNKKDYSFLQSLVKSLKKLNFKTVCEGVETAKQVDTLDEFGVDMKQGYYYSKALSESDMIEYHKNMQYKKSNK